MLNSFLCSIAVALSLLVAAAGEDEIIIETSHATIESRQGQRLGVVFGVERRLRAGSYVFQLARGAPGEFVNARLIDTPGRGPGQPTPSAQCSAPRVRAGRFTPPA